jgi:DeoR/GlpR family transcriptional regulator of sugar metabolism
LAEAVNATEATVRRDLVALEKRGMVLRSHGGASIPDALNLTPWPQLSGIAAAKASIGSLTATMVGEGEAIMLGAGTTVQAFARSLAPTSPLTVLTHSILVARELAATPNVELVMTGGSLDGSAHALVGKAAETWISEHRVSRAYLSGTSLTLDRGLQGTNPALSAVARAIVQSARSVTVLADRSKFGAEGRFDVAPTARIDELVTDGTTDDRIVESLAAGGVKVHVTPPHSALAS